MNETIKELFEKHIERGDHYADQQWEEHNLLSLMKDVIDLQKQEYINNIMAYNLINAEENIKLINNTRKIYE